MNKQEQFINQIKNIKNYWFSLPNKTAEEVVDGVLFSLLVMIDGDSGMNDFHALEIIDTEDDQQIDCGYLHEIYCSQTEEGSE
jgi:hypothetical protein